MNEKLALTAQAICRADVEWISKAGVCSIVWSRGIVGAETFAAVRPEINRKLAKDLTKLAGRTEHHRYVFFISPAFPRTERLPEKERNSVKVYSIAFNA